VDVGEILPRADEAVVAEDKLRDYALNMEHDVGRHKARVFAATLGIHADDWEWLREQILDGIQTTPVSDIRPCYNGLRCTVVLRVQGRNDDERPVVTGWRIPDDGGPPHLTTAYVETNQGRIP
jgi:hypothetical protein